MKFKVRDESGAEYQVEEIEEVKTDETETNEPLPNTCTDDALSPDEIAALKKLAGVADKLFALVDTKSDEDVVEDEDEDKDDEEIEDDDEQIEEVIDTDEPKKAAKDSIKRSAGAIEKKAKTVDSVEEDDVAQAWAKRYGGNR